MKRKANVPIGLAIDGETQQLSTDPLPFARNYQLEALEKAIKQNTIVFLETGSGKTLIAIMLLRSYAYLIRKPAPFFAVFLVPTVVLVEQQGQAVLMHTDLKVGKYWGDMGVDYWDATTWKQQVEKHEVLVMTPAILLSALRHGFLKLDLIKVLIFDECHNARGRHPYACIMTEFYHLYLKSNKTKLPRIFGMTASPIKAKGSNSEESICWQQICKLENLLNSKVYTCLNESVLAEYIPFSTPKLKFYKHMDIPYTLFEGLANKLKTLKEQYEYSLGKSSLSDSTAESTRKRLDKLFSALLFCLSELGVWLAMKAAESLSRVKTGTLLWGRLDAHGETITKTFCSDASKIFSEWIPSGPEWCIGCDTQADVVAGYMTAKVTCLIDSLLEYRDQKDLRCIIFVERIVTAIVLVALLDELLPKVTGWRTVYMAGNNSCLQTQSRNEQNHIVDEFRKGMVNLIVATSILEEGLDVQSCNLVIRFDPSATVCSFIQSRGRARMQNSDFLIMVESGDKSTLARVRKYLSSVKMMRQESLRHALDPCAPLKGELLEACYIVQATGAFVNLSSSVQLLFFYCSRLPCDGYFKYYPRFVIDKQSETCLLHLPKSCPIRTISVEGNIKTLKQLACLEACKQLHQIGALTDNLVPDIVDEEAEAQELCKFGNRAYVEEQARYVPPEIVNCSGNDAETLYYCYFIELQPDFECDILPIVLAVRTRLECDEETLKFGLDVGPDSLIVQMKYAGAIRLASEEVVLSKMFQVTVFRVLLDRNLNKLHESLGGEYQNHEFAVLDYLLLPSTGACEVPFIDWKCVHSVRFPCDRGNISKQHMNYCGTRSRRYLQTKNGLVCRCMLENSLVCTPHNGYLYCITGILDMNSNSLLDLRNGEHVTYKAYYSKRHGISLCYEGESLLRGKPLFTVQNYLHKSINQKAKEPGKASVELPPELCSVIMSPISIASFYSFSYAPSIMHRIESFLLAANLKRMHVDHCKWNYVIPTVKVLEAITTKRCQEKFHLESLEILGDSFLKYAASQQLFKAYQNQHEGLLSIKREKIISNASLCKLGYEHKISGFIRNEPFDPNTWIIPGDNSGPHRLEREILSPERIIYSGKTRTVKSKTVADVVEALIGAFLSAGGEKAALLFMEWLGIKVDFVHVPYTMPLQVNPEKLVNIKFLESLLNYSFHDASLLVEALTHGSYMLPEIPRCYQRLEFLGDAVLDYLITKLLYHKHPELSPGLLTDLRSASVNNDCYAQSAVKAGLHKHILHASQELHRHIVAAVHNFEQSPLASTFGWESEMMFPKVLGDIIESLAGAILVDSGYDKEVVFKSIMPLLEPIITPETLKLHPVRELNEVCQKEHYNKKKAVWDYENGEATITLEVEANGIRHNYSCSAADKETAEKLACKALLKLLKDSTSNPQVESHL